MSDHMDPDEEYNPQTERGLQEYYIVDLIVDGALDETLQFATEDEVTEYVDQLRAEHKKVRAESHWSVYVMHHNHPLTDETDSVIDCECNQYVTDHNPAYVIGG